MAKIGRAFGTLWDCPCGPTLPPSVFSVVFLCLLCFPAPFSKTALHAKNGQGGALPYPFSTFCVSPRRAQTRRGACGRDVFVGAHGRAPLPRRLLCLLWTFCAFCGFPALPQKRAGFRRGAAPFWSAATSRRFPKRCQGTALQKRARRCLAPTLYNLLFPLTRLRGRAIIMTDRSVIIPLPFTR